MLAEEQISSDNRSEIGPSEFSKAEPKEKPGRNISRFFGGCGFSLIISGVFILITWFIVKAKGVFATWSKIFLVTVLVFILIELLYGIFLLGHRKKSWGGGILTGGCCSFLILLILFVIFIYSLNSLFSNP